MKAHWQSMNKIPTVLFQTNKTPHPDYTLDMIRKQVWVGWDYEIYDDNAVMQFFKENPHSDFPDISINDKAYTERIYLDIIIYTYVEAFSWIFMLYYTKILHLIIILCL